MLLFCVITVVRDFESAIQKNEDGEGGRGEGGGGGVFWFGTFAMFLVAL